LPSSERPSNHSMIRETVGDCTQRKIQLGPTLSITKAIGSAKTEKKCTPGSWDLWYLLILGSFSPVWKSLADFPLNKLPGNNLLRREQKGRTQSCRIETFWATRHPTASDIIEKWLIDSHWNSCENSMLAAWRSWRNSKALRAKISRLANLPNEYPNNVERTWNLTLQVLKTLLGHSIQDIVQYFAFGCFEVWTQSDKKLGSLQDWWETCCSFMGFLTSRLFSTAQSSNSLNEYSSWWNNNSGEIRRQRRGQYPEVQLQIPGNQQNWLPRSE